MFTAPANTLSKQIYWKTRKKAKNKKREKEKKKQTTKNTLTIQKRNYCLSMKCFVLYLQVNSFFLFSYDLISIPLSTQIVLFLGLGRQEATHKEERVSAVTGCES